MNARTSPALAKVRELFVAAVGKTDREQRDAFVREMASGDEDLIREVNGLLESHDQSDDFLAISSISKIFAFDHRPSDCPGEIIGPYKLLEVIGEGGMGTVWIAEQTEPVRRKVALKVIKPGMDSKQVVARFEAERQALAMMDHPNIAKVHDGGVTPEGRPFFVMELVRGLPITEYCDQQQLSIDDRLDLFVLVCRAVQHAHQKGVIHRDLKPSNVLVTEIDGVAVPKVIDFGVAKAVGVSLTESTVYTGFHQFIGTPLYMSPEQAELAGVDVDTRSDIYSLGVLLYELLTGTTPFDSETLRKAAFDEVRRIIREEEPPRPSTRLSFLGDMLTTVSASRNSDPKRLGSSLQGELDWVVMKALEKDRNHRYETANDFAADVMRFLTDRPVEARPPTSVYRFRKFARRNRGTLMSLTLVIVSVLAGLSMTIWQAIRATRAEKRTTHALDRSREHLTLARNAVDDLYDEVAARWSFAPRYSPLPSEFLMRVLPLYERFADDGSWGVDQGRAYRRVAEILLQLERNQEAIPEIESSIRIFDRLKASDPENRAHRFDLASCYSLKHDLTQKEGINEAIDLLEGLVATDPASLDYRDTLSRNLNERGFARWSRTDPRAREDLERALEIQNRLCAEKPDDLVFRYRLGAIYRNFGLVEGKVFGNFEQAHYFLQRAIDIHEDLAARYPTRPQFHLELAWSDWAMGANFVHMQEYDKSLRYSERAREIFLGLIEESPNMQWFRRLHSWTMADIAEAQFQSDRPEDGYQAIQELERTVGYPYAFLHVWGVGMELVYSARPEFQRPAEALELSEQLLIRKPNDFHALHLKGIALYRSGNPDGALRVLTRLYQLQGETSLPASGFFLAMACYGTGDKRQARMWYDRSVSRMKQLGKTDRFVKLYRAEAATLLDIDIPRVEPQNE